MCYIEHGKFARPPHSIQALLTSRKTIVVGSLIILTVNRIDEGIVLVPAYTSSTTVVIVRWWIQWVASPKEADGMAYLMQDQSRLKLRFSQRV
jgi:hypothetical protein